jgi:hypothetical protein
MGDIDRATGQGALHIDGNDTEVNSALVGDFTIEVWAQLDALHASNDHSIILYGVGGAESEATNYLAWIYIEANTGLVRFFWEHGSSATNVDLPSDDAFPVGAMTHLAVVCSVSGGDRNVQFYINGEDAGDGSGTNASGGTSATWIIGENAANANRWDGEIREIRVSSVARTSEEIAASFESGPDTAAVDTDPPTLANLSPAPGALASNTTFEFDILDNGTIAVVTIFTDFEVSRRDEVVFDGVQFGRLYSGSIAAIEGGTHFAFSRRGGFPRLASGEVERCRLRVVCFDAAGNAVTL